MRDEFCLLNDVPFGVIFLSKDLKVSYSNDIARLIFPSLCHDINVDIASLIDCESFHDLFGLQVENSCATHNSAMQDGVVIEIPNIKGYGCVAKYRVCVTCLDAGWLCFFYNVADSVQFWRDGTNYGLDSLTGLPNREFFKEKLEGLIVKSSGATDYCFGILFIDLDKFKPINDGCGHAVGDLILKEVAIRLSSCVRDSDVVARHGGDEFVVLLPNLRSKHDSSIVAERIINSMNHEFKVGSQIFNLGASVGISIWPFDASGSDAMIDAADKAMYKSKSSGRNTYRFFSQSMNVEAQERANIESELIAALREKQFTLYYQPQFCTRTDKIHGAEALIRWVHPVKGVIPPSDFIKVAEETGLISRIGDWVLSEAIQQAKRWHSCGLFVRVAINLSARQFVDSLPSRVEELLLDADLPANFIELEITESFLVADIEKAASIVAELKRVGVRIALDDFGTGFSSLQYLRRFAVDTLKIDRSFVGKNYIEFDSRMVQAILDIARNFNLSALAEGVETMEQLEALRLSGCDYWQGFLRSRAIPADDFLDYAISYGSAIKAAA